MRTLFAACCIAAAGCCPSAETVIRTDTLHVPYAVRDTVELHVTDSLWFAQDQRVEIRIDTLWKKVYYHIHDTIPAPHTDTLRFTKEIVIEYPFLSKVRLVLMTIGCVFMIIAVGRIILAFKP